MTTEPEQISQPSDSSLNAISYAAHIMTELWLNKTDNSRCHNTQGILYTLLGSQSDCTGSHCTPHTRPFNGPFSRTIRVSRYQKDKPIWILLKQETASSSGISWVICKSAPRSRQITTPASHQSVFYRLDALPAAKPTASKH